MAEFGIHEIRTDGTTVTLTGRCYSGTIHVGQIFRRVYRTDATGAQLESRTVTLSVLRITAYHRLLTEIPEGLTAELIVSGNGTEQLQSEWVLTDD
jgi:lysyl-tRNA synthetase class I